MRKLTPRERLLLMLLAPALAIVLILVFLPAGPSAPAADPGSIELAQQRLKGLRILKSLVPAREAVMKQTSADLALRERSLVAGDTAAQAQATLLEAARRVGKADQLDIRSGDFPPPKAFGEYGMVFAKISFECHIEQLVNYLADLGRQPELIAPLDQHITAGQDRKQKTVVVQMTLAGVVAKKLIPEKKGLGSL
jgi:hypothetical protein